MESPRAAEPERRLALAEERRSADRASAFLAATAGARDRAQGQAAELGAAVSELKAFFERVVMLPQVKSFEGELCSCATERVWPGQLSLRRKATNNGSSLRVDRPSLQRAGYRSVASQPQSRSMLRAPALLRPRLQSPGWPRS
jgi:hypothetical protein